MIRTGIFGGSFNPIHNGHLQLAEAFLAAAKLDEVWLLVSPQNPLKPQSQLLLYEKRLELAHLALQNKPQLIASDYENKLPKPSFTSETLRSLQKDYPQREFCLLIGGDSLKNIHLWKNWQFIVDNFQIYVYPRNNYPSFNQQLPTNIHTINAPQLPISSTIIRQLIANKCSVSQYLPSQSIGLTEEYYSKI